MSQLLTPLTLAQAQANQSDPSLIDQGAENLIYIGLVIMIMIIILAVGVMIMLIHALRKCGSASPINRQ